MVIVLLAIMIFVIIVRLAARPASEVGSATTSLPSTSPVSPVSQSEKVSRASGRLCFANWQCPVGQKCQFNRCQPSCFPASVRVLVRDADAGNTASWTTMDQLCVGQAVAAADAQGRIVDRQPESQGECVELMTRQGYKLRLSPGHLIHRVRGDIGGDGDGVGIESTNWCRAVPVPAAKLEPGDRVFVAVESAAQWQLVPDTVHSVNVVSDRGWYAPATHQGTILVDGVAASCYAESSTINGPCGARSFAVV